MLHGNIKNRILVTFKISNVSKRKEKCYEK